MNKLTDPTYHDIHTACTNLVDFINEQPHHIQIDQILAIARGGLIPGVILSHLLNIPITSLDYSSITGAGDDKNHSNDLPVMKGKRLLIVDDIADTGNTLREVEDFYAPDNTIYTYAVFYKKQSPLYESMNRSPTFYSFELPFDFPFINFPWEKGDVHY